MSLLADGDAECALFGGWAEELLGLRPPGQHNDIDLVYCSLDFSAIERVMAEQDELTEVPAKRFAHKRAFLYDGVLIEVLLVRDWNSAPFTLFWGDTRFEWQVPLLHDDPVPVEGRSIVVVSPDNLRKYRRKRPLIRPRRWADPESRVP